MREQAGAKEVNFGEQIPELEVEDEEPTSVTEHRMAF
jgi:hypothetical protein